jgi:hypothetical protein
LLLIEDKEPDEQLKSHCRARRGGKAFFRGVKPEDLPVAYKVTWTDEDSVYL